MKTETVCCRLAAIVIVMMRSEEKETHGQRIPHSPWHSHAVLERKIWPRDMAGKREKVKGGGSGIARKLIISHRHPIGKATDHSVRRCDNQLIINYILFLFNANDNIPTASL